MTEDHFDILKGGLKERMRVLKLRGTTGGSIAANEYNAEVKPSHVSPETDDYPIHWLGPNDWEGKDVFCGEDALRLDDPEGETWSLRWPYAMGNFKTLSYTSPQELLSDVQAVLVDAIETKCEIDREKFEECSAVLLIPDLYDDAYIGEMCEMLLGSMGFAQIVLQQVGIYSRKRVKRRSLTMPCFDRRGFALHSLPVCLQLA
jgi:actin-related protein 8